MKISKFLLVLLSNNKFSYKNLIKNLFAKNRFNKYIIEYIVHLYITMKNLMLIIPLKNGQKKNFLHSPGGWYTDLRPVSTKSTMILGVAVWLLCKM